MSHCGLRHVVQPVGERGAGGWRHSAVLLENGEPVARAIPLSRWLAPFRSGPVACAIPLSRWLAPGRSAGGLCYAAQVCEARWSVSCLI